MIRQRKPLKRSWIKVKKRVRKVNMPWKPERIREDSAGMARLRSEAFKRSGGICECGESCGKRVTWGGYEQGQLHHVISRAHGGSDVLENVQFITRYCHQEIHGMPKWGLAKCQHITRKR